MLTMNRKILCIITALLGMVGILKVFSKLYIRSSGEGHDQKIITEGHQELNKE